MGGDHDLLDPLILDLGLYAVFNELRRCDDVRIALPDLLRSEELLLENRDRLSQLLLNRVLRNINSVLSDCSYPIHLIGDVKRPAFPWSARWFWLFDWCR